MSSPILPISDPLGSSETPASAPAGADDLAALVYELGASDRSPAIEAARGGPPAELLQQMLQASEIGASMRQRGLELRFSNDRIARAPTIELHDSETSSVRRLTVVEAMELAHGEAAE